MKHNCNNIKHYNFSIVRFGEKIGREVQNFRCRDMVKYYEWLSNDCKDKIAIGRKLKSGISCKQHKINLTIGKIIGSVRSI
jgi:hypothetical protein